MTELQRARKNAKARIKYAEQKGYNFSQEFKDIIKEFDIEDLNNLRGQELLSKGYTDNAIDYTSVIDSVRYNIQSYETVAPVQSKLYLKIFDEAVAEQGSERIYNKIISDGYEETLRFIDEALRYKENEMTKPQLKSNLNEWVEHFTGRAMSLDETMKWQREFDDTPTEYRLLSYTDD